MPCSKRIVVNALILWMLLSQKVWLQNVCLGGHLVHVVALGQSLILGGHPYIVKQVSLFCYIHRMMRVNTGQQMICMSTRSTAAVCVFCTCLKMPPWLSMSQGYSQHWNHTGRHPPGGSECHSPQLRGCGHVPASWSQRRAVFLRQQFPPRAPGAAVHRHNREKGDEAVPAHERHCVREGHWACWQKPGEEIQKKVLGGEKEKKEYHHCPMGGYGSANWFFFFVKSRFCIYGHLKDLTL